MAVIRGSWRLKPQSDAIYGGVFRLPGPPELPISVSSFPDGLCGLGLSRWDERDQAGEPPESTFQTFICDKA